MMNTVRWTIQSVLDPNEAPFFYAAFWGGNKNTEDSHVVFSPPASNDLVVARRGRETHMLWSLGNIHGVFLISPFLGKPECKRNKNI